MITSVRRRELPNCVAIGSTEAAPMWMKYTVPGSRFFNTFSSRFVNSSTDHNSGRILESDGSNDVVWRKDVPFECPKYCNQI